MGIQNFEYSEALEECFALLQNDYEHAEAHELVLKVFHELGFKN